MEGVVLVLLVMQLLTPVLLGLLKCDSIELKNRKCSCHTADQIQQQMQILNKVKSLNPSSF